jgi:hypothetical protein
VINRIPLHNSANSKAPERPEHLEPKALANRGRRRTSNTGLSENKTEVIGKKTDKRTT